MVAIGVFGRSANYHRQHLVADIYRFRKLIWQFYVLVTHCFIGLFPEAQT